MTNIARILYFSFAFVVGIIFIIPILTTIENGDYEFTFFFIIIIAVVYYLIFTTYLINEENLKIKNSNIYEEVEVIELNGRKYIKDTNDIYLAIKEPTKTDIETNGVKTKILIKKVGDKKYAETENGEFILVS